MQKAGNFRTFNDDKKYNVILYTDGSLFERIDVFEDIETYGDPMNPIGCTASYISHKGECIYGDSKLIEMLLRCRAQSSSLISNTMAEQNVSFEDGKIYITQTKSSLDGNSSYEVITENGILYSEVFKSEECELGFYDVKPNSFTQPVIPFTRPLYADISFYNGTVQEEDSTAEFYSLEYLKSKYDLSHIDDKDYVVVTSLEEADERLQSFINSHSKIKSVDTETTGTDIYITGDDVLTGVVLAEDENTSTYFPFMQEECEFNLPMEYLEKIQNALLEQPKDTIIVAHNAPFEKMIFLKHGYYCRVDADTFVLSILINPVIRKGLHALKTLAFRALGLKFLELEDIFKGEIKFNKLPPEIIRYYACPDPTNTIVVYKYLINLLPKDEIGIFNLENQLLDVKAENQFYGLRADVDYYMKAYDNEVYKTDLLRKLFQSMHKTDRNINSSPVKADIIYNKLKAKVEVRTDTGAPSTSVEAINRIVDLGTLKDEDVEGLEVPKDILDMYGKVIVSGKDLLKNKYPSLVILQAYNKAQKERGALKRILSKTKNGRISFRINQVGAASGRQTSDAHQYSKVMKKGIIADTPFHKFVDADFSQIELRVLAYLAKQQDLIELESDCDVDVHRAIGSILTGIPMWAITDEMRSKDKSRNFGVVYMMSEWGLAKRNHGPGYTKKDLIEARQSITDFYNGLPGVKKLVAANEEFIRENGFIKTKLGRYRFFKHVLEPGATEEEIAAAVRAGNNTPVQGYAADYLKIVEVRIMEYIKAKGWDKREVEYNGNMYPYVRMMLSVHDEVLISVHESIPLIEVTIMLKECMELEIEGAPPFFASPSFINDWLDAKDDKYAIPTRYRDYIIEEYLKTGECDVNYDNYLDKLEEYNDAQLKIYMSELIQKYKTPEEVAKHVRHDKYTHDLIHFYVSKKDGIKDQVGRINLAVQRYMENYKPDDKLIDHLNDDDEEFNADLQIEGLIDEYVEFDDNGNVVPFEYRGEDEEDKDDIASFRREFDKELDEVEATYCFYMMDRLIVDFTELGIDCEEANEVNRKLVSMHNPNNYYKLCYVLNNKKAELDYLLPYDKSTINNMMREAIECKKKRMS